MLADKLTGSSVQLASSTVIAQALPGPQDVRLSGRSQVGHGRKPLQKSLEIVADPLDLGLLQHDLADPDAVGITGPPPGQIPARPAVPGEQRPDNGGGRPRQLGGIGWLQSTSISPVGVCCHLQSCPVSVPTSGGKRATGGDRPAVLRAIHPCRSQAAVTG